MPRVTDDCPVFHQTKMSFINYVAVASYCDKNITLRGSPLNRHDTESIHYSLKCFHWIDLRNNYVSAHTTSTHCHPFPTPAITNNNHCPASQQDIGSTNDTI